MNFWRINSMGEMLKFKDNNGVYFIKNEDGTYSALEYSPFINIEILSDNRPWWWRS